MVVLVSGKGRVVMMVRFCGGVNKKYLDVSTQNHSDRGA